MSILLVYSHPDPKSLTHAIADHLITALTADGHLVHGHDLYREHFQPVLENEQIKRRFAFDDHFTTYATQLHEAHGLVFVYPDWWGMPPAILKGWLDRVFAPELAYRHEGAEFLPKEQKPLLVGKRAFVVNTTNESNPLSQQAMYALWRERIFTYVGITEPVFKTLYDVRHSTGPQRRTWLKEIQEIACHLF